MVRHDAGTGLPGGQEGNVPDGQDAAMERGLDLLRDLPGFAGHAFNPADVVRCVNHLQRSGIGLTMAVLHAYAGQVGDSDVQNVLLAARVLFSSESDSPRLPELDLGWPDPEPPAGAHFPRFPIAVYQGIPFLLIGGYLLGGESLPPMDHVATYASEFEFLQAPLVPGNDPLASADGLLDSASWGPLGPTATHVALLHLQALRMVSSVYPVVIQDETFLVSGEEARKWSEHRRSYAALDAVWDPTVDDYRIRGETAQALPTTGGEGGTG